MDNIVNPTIRFPNFYVDGFGGGATYVEHGLGSASTITASVEYPAGTYTQIKFSGSSSGSIPNLSYLDGSCTISIPQGSKFYVRYFVNNASGVVFCLGLGGTSNVPGNYAYGDVLDAAVSGLTDNTMGGAYTATSGTSRYSPIIIAATTTKASFLVVGDSKCYGEQDTGDASGSIGEVERWLSPYFANAKWGIRGRDASQFLASCTLQTSMNQFFTHLINEDGVNGFIHGRTATQVATDTDALGNSFPTLKKYFVTILPAATTTDNYATLANQTVPTWEAGRVTENTRRRGVPAPWLGCFDSSAAVESALNSGKIPAGSGYFSNLSSVHPQQAGYLRIATVNSPAASLLTR
jgi:hypothetical protein